MLGAVAILGTAGILAWGMSTVADLKSGAPVRSAELAVPSKNELPRDFAARFANQRPESSPSGWNSDLDWLSKGSIVPQTLVPDSKLFWADQGPDLPLPAPPISPSELETRHADVAQVPVPEGSVPQVLVPQVPAPRMPAEHQKRFSRDPKPDPARAAAPKPQKLAARPYYLEKLVEQGDAGEVKFRYRRQVCAPPHMVDVCFMPPENRRAIVVKRW
jgi:hypothetical protein